MPSPDQIGRYRVDRRLGSGAFAVVWLAHDDRLEAPVAVKVMADNWAHRMDIRDRFLAEARLLRKASSGGVVQVFDVGELDDERPYFVMEYADQGTVADRMTLGPLPVAEAVRLTAEAARGAEALHEAGVVHRDIKPSNVLLTSGGVRGRERVLVADLGLAKNLAHASGLTVVAGSVGYMAPEQAEPFEGIDARADVYSLGAVLYHLVSGATPGTPDRVMPLDELRPGLPPGVGAAVGRAMEPDREQRWPTAAALARELDRIGETLEHAEDEQAAPGTGESASDAEGQDGSGAPSWASPSAMPSTVRPASPGAAQPATVAAEPPSRTSGAGAGRPTAPEAPSAGAGPGSGPGTAEPDRAEPAAAEPAVTEPDRAEPASSGSVSSGTTSSGTTAPGSDSSGSAAGEPVSAGRSHASPGRAPDSALPEGAQSAGGSSAVGSSSEAAAPGMSAPGMSGVGVSAAGAPDSASDPAAGHPSSAGTASARPARRRRTRALAFGAAVVVLAGVGVAATALAPDPQRTPSTVKVRDTSGRISVRVPGTWAREFTDSGWNPSSLGLSAEHAPGLLVAEDVHGWQDLTSKTSGVFVGLGSAEGKGGESASADAGDAGDGASGADGAAEALPDKVAGIKHSECDYAGSRTFSGGGWSGRIRTWSSCASGYSLEEIGLKPTKKGASPVYVQIRCEGGCSDKTDKVLDSLRVTADAS
ncbi:protein kinase [Streptomyces sp. NPDC007025]|uniref:serine/threonine-protein kinase n=1 Tax=Streptomyces sp. NPDC007025 TaxID=3364771 RepID=UPI0036CC115F